jgi:hypothetical protein
MVLGMSDPPAPGWWQASNGEWYPPERHPDYGRLLEEAGRDTTARQWYSTHRPPLVSDPRRFDPGRWTFSPYAFGAMCCSVAALVAYLVFGPRFWIAAAVPAAWLVRRARTWTEDGNGGHLMGRVARWVFVASAFPPVALAATGVGTTLYERITSGPNPWELEVGQCVDLDSPGDPEKAPRNWQRVKVVDCAGGHLAEVLAVTEMGAGREERLAAFHSPDETAYWNSMAVSKCEERVDSAIATSIEGRATIGFLRWHYEHLTRSANPPGYGFLVCVATSADGAPLVGSVLPE